MYPLFCNYVPTGLNNNLNFKIWLQTTHISGKQVSSSSNTRKTKIIISKLAPISLKGGEISSLTPTKGRRLHGINFNPILTRAKISIIWGTDERVFTAPWTSRLKRSVRSWLLRNSSHRRWKGAANLISPWQSYKRVERRKVILKLSGYCLNDSAKCGS